MAFVKNQSYNRQSRNFPGVSVFSPIQLHLGKMLTILFAFSFCQPPRCAFNLYVAVFCWTERQRRLRELWAPACLPERVILLGLFLKPPPSLLFSVHRHVTGGISWVCSLIRRMVSLVLCLSVLLPFCFYPPDDMFNWLIAIRIAYCYNWWRRGWDSLEQR